VREFTLNAVADKDQKTTGELRPHGPENLVLCRAVVCDAARRSPVVPTAEVESCDDCAVARRDGGS
jgi:hypothetical protein